MNLVHDTIDLTALEFGDFQLDRKFTSVAPFETELKEMFGQQVLAKGLDLQLVTHSVSQWEFEVDVKRLL